MTLSEVEQLEERLQLAMLVGNVDDLHDLLSDRLRFVALDGTTIGKKEDLAAYHSDRLRFYSLVPGKRYVELLGEDVALVNVAMQVAGRFDGAGFVGGFRYTRVWCRENNGYARIVAGQVCAIQGDPT